MALIHPDFVAVRFIDTLSHADRGAVAESCHLAGRDQRQELPGESFTLFRVAAGPGGRRRDRHGRAMRALAAHRHVVRAAPVFRHGAVRSIATDRIWIGLRGARRAALDTLLRRGARLLESSEVDREYLVELAPDVDPDRTSRRLAALRSVAFAEPDRVLVGRRFAATHGTVRPGAGSYAFRQIGADRAWRVQRGRREITIALVDDGVLASHPDLAGTVVTRYDATRQGTAIRPKPWDCHGTECAALAAGAGRRRDGVRGVAAGCGIAAVRVGFTPSRFDDYVTKTSWLRRGVDWAWQQGAAVLSMSFGGGPPMTPVTRALERARTHGRGGKGCVLVAAAGNSGIAKVEYPAVVDGIMAVAATDQHNRPASFSNRGRAVAIAAPGVNIRTATIPDPEEQEPGWYRTDSGTSLAVPLVAGAAALVLCRNPGLPESQVRELLGRTASRRGGSFVRGRNDRVGAGRLDAGRAVVAAGRDMAATPRARR